MKTNLQKVKLGEVKVATRPNWKESEFAKTTNGQIMKIVDRAVKNGHFIEPQVLSWTTKEQIL